MNGRLLCYVRGFTQLPQKRKAATYFEGPGGHGRPLLAGSYVTQRVRLAYSKPGTSTGQADMEQSKSKDRIVYAHDPKLPYFNDSKDKMDSYWSQFERYSTANKWDSSLWAAYLSALLKGQSLDVYDRLSD